MTTGCAFVLRLAMSSTLMKAPISFPPIDYAGLPAMLTENAFSLEK
jgi:hypothetical protein